MISFIFNLVALSYQIKPNNRTDETYRLQKEIMRIGYDYPTSSKMINICKSKAGNQNARKCVMWLTAVGVAESTACMNQRHNNCRGLMSEGSVMKFDSMSEGIEFWVDRYYLFWRGNKTPQDRITRSMYCHGDCEYRIKNTSRVIEYFNFVKLN